MTKRSPCKSWGENLKDDGGAEARDKDGKPRMFGPEGDWVFWPQDMD
jgi:hypothetical protein